MRERVAVVLNSKDADGGIISIVPLDGVLSRYRLVSSVIYSIQRAGSFRQR